MNIELWEPEPSADPSVSGNLVLFCDVETAKMDGIFGGSISISYGRKIFKTKRGNVWKVESYDPHLVCIGDSGVCWVCGKEME